jgi:hypothetical protein
MKRWRLRPDVDFDSLLKFGFEYKQGNSYTRISVKKYEIGSLRSISTLFISGPNAIFPRRISLEYCWGHMGPYNEDSIELELKIELQDLIEAGLVEAYGR